MNIYNFFDLSSERKVCYMANTATVYARIDPELKADVEVILKKLGITPSSLIQMLYSQIKLTNSVPLTLAIPSTKPLSVKTMTKEEFNTELQKGIDDAKYGRVFSMDELDTLLKEKCGI